MERLHRLVSVVILLMLSIALAGCSQEEIYNRALDNCRNAQQLIRDAGNGDIAVGSGTLEGAGQAVDDALAAGTGYLSDVSKKAGIYVIAGSEIVGILLYIVSSRARSIKLKKTAVMVFILAIPILTVIAIYGLAILAGWFS